MAPLHLAEMVPLPLAEWSEPPKVAILIATLLLAALIGDRTARAMHIPRVVGYLLLGLILRLVLPWVTAGAERTGDSLQDTIGLVNIIKSLALCLILFAIGTSFDRAHLRAIRRHAWKLSLAEISTVSVVVFLATWVAGRDHSPVQALFLASAAIATAPAATLLVLRQYGAKGPATDHVLALICAASSGLHTEPLRYGLSGSLLMATLGSAAAGALLGMVLSLMHLSLTRFETTLAFFGIMFATCVAAKPLGIPYNALILAMFMGLTFVNFSIQPRQFLSGLEPIWAPIFALFFVLAGFSLEISRLWQVGAVGIAFVAARTIGKIGGAALGVRWIGPRHRVPPEIGTAMLCQAGVAIGLGKYLVEHWGRQTAAGFEPDPDAVVVNTVILASVVIFELAGPLATKHAVVRAGEVKAINLLARPGGSVREMATLLSRLRRLVAVKQQDKPGVEAQTLTVRHIMRTNIESLNETAKMNEVLRFVEHSRHHQFYVVNEEGHLVGTLNFKDLRNLVYNPVLARFLTAYDMANTAPPVILADQPLRQVLDVFHQRDVGSLPVIENEESRRLLGVVEQRDVLRALHVGESDEREEDSH